MASGTLVVQCCVCKKIRQVGKDSNCWVDAYIFPSVAISHSYCPICLQEALKQIDDVQPRIDRVRSKEEKNP